MKAKAYAKINLSLDVVGKREDGYHLLEMIMQNVDIYDELEFKICNEGIKINCDGGNIPLNKNNLIYKAIDLFFKTYDIKSGIEVSVVKNIPVAAGMAGGSADAAVTLKCMRDMFKNDVTDEELMKLGLQIGADVPYCILGGTALCEGIGEVVTPLKSFKGKTLVVVKPNFGVSTVWVYKNIDINKIHKHPKTKELIGAIKSDDLMYICNNMRNVLENVTIKEYPVIRKIKEQMIEYGAIGSMMSGSGPTVFGFFDDDKKAEEYYEVVKEKYNKCYITKTI